MWRRRMRFIRHQTLAFGLVVSVGASMVAYGPLHATPGETASPQDRPRDGTTTPQVSEFALRGLAMYAPPPVIPAQVKLRGALDVAVCSVRVDGNGQVDQLEVLEAPNPDVAAILR